MCHMKFTFDQPYEYLNYELLSLTMPVGLKMFEGKNSNLGSFFSLISLFSMSSCASAEVGKSRPISTVMYYYVVVLK